MASASVGREGHGPLHLRQGLVILPLIKIDRAQDHVVPVEGVIEGQGPLRRRYCRIQRLVSGTLLRDPLQQVTDGQFRWAGI